MAGVKGRSGGRNAKSPEEHRRQGTYQRCRHAGFESPTVEPGDPVPPGPLDALARAEWGRMLERMRTTKIVTSVDDAALYQYARLWSETEGISRDHDATRRAIRLLQREALHKLAGDELVRAIEALERMKATLQRQATQLRMQRLALRTWLIEFGMTPAARPRVRIPTADPAKKPESKLLAFLGGKGAPA